MTSFHDVSFPAIWIGRAEVRVEHPVTVHSRDSGLEERQSSRSASTRTFHFAEMTAPIGEAQELLAFFQARRGALHGFRFRDRMDWKSCALNQAPGPLDQALGVGDGVNRAFILSKRGPATPVAPERRISRPAVGSVVVAVNGALVPSAYVSVDVSSGAIQLAQAPDVGAVVSAGFVFDTPVRFAGSPLSVKPIDGQSARIGEFSLVEVLEP